MSKHYKSKVKSFSIWPDSALSWKTLIFPTIAFVKSLYFYEGWKVLLLYHVWCCMYERYLLILNSYYLCYTVLQLMVSGISGGNGENVLWHVAEEYDYVSAHVTDLTLMEQIVSDQKTTRKYVRPTYARVRQWDYVYIRKYYFQIHTHSLCGNYLPEP